MNGKPTLSERAYENMLDLLNQAYRQEQPGRQIDMQFVRQDYWLPDTQVIDRIDASLGQWQVNLLFVHVLNPFRFVRRLIRQYPTRSRAELAAHYMRRQAAKDQRGHLTVHPNLITFEGS